MRLIRWPILFAFIITASARNAQATPPPVLGTLEVPCNPGATPLPGHSGPEENKGLKPCSAGIPEIVDLVRKALLLRVQSYYRGCDPEGVFAPGPSPTPTPTPSPLPSAVPTTCGELAAPTYANLCGGIPHGFTDLICNLSADRDFATLGVNGCTPEKTSNHLGQNCGSYVAFTASGVTSRHCNLSAAATGASGRREVAYSLGMLIHSHVESYEQIRAEIQSGKLNLTQPASVALAEGGAGIGPSPTPTPSPAPSPSASGSGSIRWRVQELTDNPNVEDVDICARRLQGSEDPLILARSRANLYVSSCHLSALRSHIEAQFAQVALLEIIHRAELQYQRFALSVLPLPPQIASTMSFRVNTCTSTSAQAQYESRYLPDFWNRARAQWPTLPASPPP